MIKHKDIPAALAHLDGLAYGRAIAAHMRDIGVKGQRGKHQTCALANYLRASVPGLVHVMVNPMTQTKSVVFWCDERSQEGLRDLPGLVHTFVLDFDEGAYPELVK